jgi:hypothetical protein
MTRLGRALALLSLAAVCALAAAPGAEAGSGDPDRGEARVDGTCTGGVRSELRLKADDGLLELEFELDRARAGAQWRIVLVHERRVVWKGMRRTRSGGSVEVRSTLRDLPGADTVTARAWGPAGLGCRATATLSPA